MAQALVIVGAGGFGRAVCEVLLELDGARVLGFLDDRAGTLTEVDGLPVLGRCSDLHLVSAQDARLVLAIGRNADRARLAQQAAVCDLPLHSVVHPRAIVARSASLGEGSIVMAGAVIGAHVRLGRGCIINLGAVLDHDAWLDDFARVGAGACIGGGARLDAGALVDDGAIIAAGSGNVQARQSLARQPR